MAEKRNCDNNGDSSDKNRVHKTQSFETKLDILKHIDNGEGHGEIAQSLGLSHSTISTTVKNIVKIMEHVKSAGSLQSLIVNTKRSVLIEETEHLLKIAWMIKHKGVYQ
jgi:DNA-binding CsgD family transcriptional regulator